MEKLQCWSATFLIKQVLNQSNCRLWFLFDRHAVGSIPPSTSLFQISISQNFQRKNKRKIQLLKRKVFSSVEWVLNRNSREENLSSSLLTEGSLRQVLRGFKSLDRPPGFFSINFFSLFQNIEQYFCKTQSTTKLILCIVSLSWTLKKIWVLRG